MASPFKVFRKHQKVMLAGLTILAMFSFVFLGVIADLMGTRGVQNPVVLRSKYGKITQRDLQFMHMERLRFFAILEKLLVKALNLNPVVCRQLIEKRFGAASEEDVVNTWIKARYAEELGMIVSNQTIREFLQTICQNRIPLQEVSILIKQEGLTENQFFDIVREELRANEVFHLFLFSLEGSTPAQRWNYFCQLRRQAAVELIPLKVEQFLDKIENPNEAELKAYFERYKDKLPTPDSPEPGFRIPQKIDVQYLKADYEKFSAADAISEEEIRNYYEKNRDYFKQYEKEIESSLKPEEKAAPEKKDAPPEKPESADSKSAETPPPNEAKTPADQPKSPPEKTAAKTETSTPTNTVASAADKKDSPPEKTAAPQEEVAKKSSPESSAEKTEADKSVLSDKVKEAIRARIAIEKMSAIFTQLRQEMDENGKKWRKYEAQKIHHEEAAPPQHLDFEALAQKHGLSFARTGLIANWELQKLDIGFSIVQGSQSFISAAFKTLGTFKAEIAFDTSGNGYLFWKVYDTPESEPSWDDENVRKQVTYAWKFNRAREIALEEAKKIAAAAKTGASLKELFADRSDLQVLTPAPFSFYTEGNVPRGSSDMALRLSTVDDAPLLGEDFMRAVFALDEKQVGAAMNAPQTVAYVIRLVEYSPSQDVLWKLFLIDDFSKYAAPARMEIEWEARQWLEDLKKSAGFKWEERVPGERASAPPATDYYDE